MRGCISRRCFAQRSARHEVVPKFQRRGAWSRNHPDCATPGPHSCGMNNVLHECNARSCQSCYSLLPPARGCGEWAACLPAPEQNGRWARAGLSWGIDFPAVCMQVHTYGDWGPMTVHCSPPAASRTFGECTAARIGHLCVHWMSQGSYESGVGGRSPTNDRGSSNLLYIHGQLSRTTRPPKARRALTATGRSLQLTWRNSTAMS